MRSCIRLSYIAVFCLLAARVLAAAPFDANERPQDPAASPDPLYADRENPASASQAAAIWEARLASAPGDLESAWKLARARYWMGTKGPGGNDEKKRLLEAGMAAARHMIERAPSRPEGHFWLAANMGGLAEAHGLRQGIRYRGAIKDALETVLQLDAGYLDGSADRALGRWYFKVPGLFGGSKRRSEEHLRKALAYNPDSVITRLFLAETLIDMNREDEARRELEAAIAAPFDPDWAPEDRLFKQQARRLLAELSR